MWAGREPSLSRAAGTGRCITAHTRPTVYTCRQRPELNPSYQVSHQLQSTVMKAAQTPWKSCWFIHFPVGCFLHNVFSLLLYCSHQAGRSPVLFQVPLGSLSTMKETKNSCIYKLKIALALGKAAADGERLCGSCSLPKPQRGQRVFCSSNAQLASGSLRGCSQRVTNWERAVNQGTVV